MYPGTMIIGSNILDVRISILKVSPTTSNIPIKMIIEFIFHIQTRIIINP